MFSYICDRYACVLRAQAVQEKNRKHYNLKFINRYLVQIMRKLLSMMAMLSLFIAVSCEKNETPSAGQKEKVNFSFTDVAVTHSSVNITITPSDLDVNYYVRLAEVATFEGKDNATIIDEMLVAPDVKMCKGVQEMSFNDLMPDTSYNFAVFAYGATDDVSFFYVKTGVQEDVDLLIDIKVSNITDKHATISLTPSHDSVRYFARVVTKMEQNMTDGTDLDLVKYCLENPYYTQYIRQGAVTYDYVASPKMDYIVVAFNFDNIDDVMNGIEPLRLFKYEFQTPDTGQVNPDTMFDLSGFEATSNGFTLNVVPKLGDDAFWSYYVYTKKSYDEELARNYNQVVMHAYFGLQGLLNEYNVANEPNIDFNTFINDYMGFRGAQTITSYERLRPDSEYVLVLFYMDPNVIDPTVVYDYSYVPVPFTTLEADSDISITVEGPYFEEHKILFNIQVSDEAYSLVYGPAQWSDLIAQYYNYDDPTDGDAIRAFINRVTASEDVLADAKSEQGATIAFDAPDGFDGIFLFEAENNAGKRAQYVVRVTPDMFQ